MKRIIALLIVVSTVLFLYSRVGKTPAIWGARDNNQTAQEVQSPNRVSIVGIPITLKIPKISVNTQVEQVGMEQDGRMGVPGSSYTVGWWKLGVRPGEVGSAVMAGHLDTPQGKAGVFWDLGKLQNGDQIIVTDEFGKEYKFVVTGFETFADATFPIKKVFAAEDGKYLNLITCNGTWDKQAKNYDKRLVVFARLEE